MELCSYCGRWASLDVAEVFLDTRELVLDACCEDNLSGWIDSIDLFPRRERARWMFEKTGLIVKDILVANDTLYWTLDYGLELRPVSFAEAKEFIRTHHRHCDPPVGWNTVRRCSMAANWSELSPQAGRYRAYSQRSDASRSPGYA